jgi:hypothetical protein
MVPVPLIISKVFIKRFLKAGATDAQHAVPPSEIQVHQNMVFSRLVSRGKIVDAGNGRFFVNTTKL